MPLLMPGEKLTTLLLIFAFKAQPEPLDHKNPNQNNKQTPQRHWRPAWSPVESTNSYFCLISYQSTNHATPTERNISTLDFRSILFPDFHLPFSRAAPHWPSGEGSIIVEKLRLFSRIPCHRSPMMPSMCSTPPDFV